MHRIKLGLRFKHDTCQCPGGEFKFTITDGLDIGVNISCFDHIILVILSTQYKDILQLADIVNKFNLLIYSIRSVLELMYGYFLSLDKIDGLGYPTDELDLDKYTGYIYDTQKIYINHLNLIFRCCPIDINTNSLKNAVDKLYRMTKSTHDMDIFKCRALKTYQLLKSNNYEHLIMEHKMMLAESVIGSIIDIMTTEGIIDNTIYPEVEQKFKNIFISYLGEDSVALHKLERTCIKELSVTAIKHKKERIITDLIEKFWTLMANSRNKTIHIKSKNMLLSEKFESVGIKNDVHTHLYSIRLLILIARIYFLHELFSDLEIPKSRIDSASEIMASTEDEINEQIENMARIKNTWGGLIKRVNKINNR